MLMSEKIIIPSMGKRPRSDPFGVFRRRTERCAQELGSAAPPASGGGSAAINTIPEVSPVFVVHAAATRRRRVAT